MKIFEVTENKAQPIVIFGGRFQPFHLGHFEAYKKLVKKFGLANVYISTSNKTNLESSLGKISPFDFSEKKKIIHEIYGIPEDKILQVVNPLFSGLEIAKKLNGTTRPVIIASGLKDCSRFENLKTYHQYSNSVDLKPISASIAYYIPMMSEKEGFSATEARKMILSSKNMVDLKKSFITIFGKYDESICNLISSKLKEVKA